jgi:transcriptional repressor NrdR
VVCPFCSGSDTRVVDSRLAEPGSAVRRRRECDSCGNRFTTYERVEHAPVSIVKRNGRRDRFDRQKLLRGLTRAAGGRPVSEEQLEILADSIAAAVRRRGSEVPAEEVGDLAERGLARLDPVSAIQFASVYRNLRDLDELEAVVRRYKETGPSDPEFSIASPSEGITPSTESRSSHVRQP